MRSGVDSHCGWPHGLPLCCPLICQLQWAYALYCQVFPVTRRPGVNSHCGWPNGLPLCYPVGLPLTCHRQWASAPYCWAFPVAMDFHHDGAHGLPLCCPIGLSLPFQLQWAYASCFNVNLEMAYCHYLCAHGPPFYWIADLMFFYANITGFMPPVAV